MRRHQTDRIVRFLAVLLVSGEVACIAPVGVPQPQASVLGCYDFTVVGWTADYASALGLTPPEQVRLTDLQVAAIPGQTSWQVLPWWGDVKGTWTNLKPYAASSSVAEALHDPRVTEPLLAQDSIVLNWRRYEVLPQPDSVELWPLTGLEIRMVPSDGGYSGLASPTTPDPALPPMAASLRRRPCDDRS